MSEFVDESERSAFDNGSYARLGPCPRRQLGAPVPDSVLLLMACEALRGAGFDFRSLPLLDVWWQRNQGDLFQAWRWVETNMVPSLWRERCVK